MAGSTRLRLGDVRAIYELLGQCTELWDDAPAWRHHVVAGLTRLLDSRVGFMVLSDGDPMARASGQPLMLHGWDDPAQEAHFRKSLNVPLAQILPEAGPVLARLTHRPFVCASIHEMIPLATWHRSEGFNRYHRPAGTDALVVSMRLRGPGQVEFLGGARAPGDTPLSVRHRRITALLHRELATMIGQRLARSDQLGRHSLSPRLRQTLDGLLAGRSEKQIAHRLHLSTATVHSHVTALYRRFNVASRAELLHYFLRRQPRIAEPVRDRRGEVAGG